jgi:tetratricopeptide (TPR) repeat protein
MDEFLSDAWIGIGVVLDYLNRTHEALPYIKNAINIDPTRGTYWFILGDLQLKMGFIKEGEESYRKVVEFEPENPEIWVFLTNLLLEKGEINEAKEFISEAIEVHPINARIKYQQAEIDLHLGNQQEALIHAAEAFAYDYDLYEKIADELPKFAMNNVIRGLLEKFKN